MKTESNQEHPQTLPLVLLQATPDGLDESRPRRSICCKPPASASPRVCLHFDSWTHLPSCHLRTPASSCYYHGPASSGHDLPLFVGRAAPMDTGIKLCPPVCLKPLAHHRQDITELTPSRPRLDSSRVARGLNPSGRHGLKSTPTCFRSGPPPSLPWPSHRCGLHRCVAAARQTARRSRFTLEPLGFDPPFLIRRGGCTINRQPL